MYRRNINAIIDAWNTGNFDELSEFVMIETIRHSPPSLNSHAESLEELKTIITEFRTSFPDLHLELNEELYQEGRSIIRWTFTGTNTGSGKYGPTGKNVRIAGASISHYEDDKLKEEYLFFDTVDFFTQLGLIDATQAAAG